MESQNFKCKTCGAFLDELVAKSTNGLVKCPYCSNIWTIPKKETSPAALDFLRMGEHDLDTCKFDDALAAYKKASELDQNEPEAYFGMALAEFKIQYLKVEPTKKDEKVRLQPICHEVTQKKFTESMNYRRAFRYATEKQQTEYEKKGEEIDYILGEFFKLKQSGVDYDCFLCVKVTDDATKQPTEDSQDADYIYRLLQNKGYKPFYSERELRNATGADYEARILYALAASECMLVVCRKEEFLQTPWVKNEYTRFLKLVNDEEKESDSITIVFYKKPIERLPGRNGKLQGIDFSLREADGKILDFVGDHTPEARRKKAEEEKKKAEEEKKKAAHDEEQEKRLAQLERELKKTTNGSRSALGNLLTRAWQEMDARDFLSADRYFSSVLDMDPTNEEAWRGKFLAEFETTTEAALLNEITIDNVQNVIHSKNLKNFLKNKTTNQYDNVYLKIKEKAEEVIHGELSKHDIKLQIHKRAIRRRNIIKTIVAIPILIVIYCAFLAISDIFRDSFHIGIFNPIVCFVISAIVTLGLYIFIFPHFGWLSNSDDKQKVKAIEAEIKALSHELTNATNTLFSTI